PARGAVAGGNREILAACTPCKGYPRPRSRAPRPAGRSACAVRPAPGCPDCSDDGAEAGAAAVAAGHLLQFGLAEFALVDAGGLGRLRGLLALGPDRHWSVLLCSSCRCLRH